MKSFELEKLITDHYERKIVELDEESHQLFEIFINKLDSGTIRAAEKKDGVWKVNTWVKKGILLGFRLGKNSDFSLNDHFQFCDKQTYPLKNLKPLAKNNIRLVPGGSSVRRGAYLGNQVTLMPPMYINVGAYVDEGTMIDSHALVGSCAQIGQRVHISAGSQVGGILEPVGALPVIIEDDVLVGGNCGIYEGTIIQNGAVLGAGTILTGSVPVYDLITEKIFRGSSENPLIIPTNAIVVPGSRKIKNNFASSHGLQISCPVIVKYRDSSTNLSTTLEELLR